MGFSWQSILIILFIVLLLFGTKRLRNVGSDMGAAIKGFRSSMKDGAKADEEPEKLSKDGEQSQGSSERTGERQDEQR